MRKNKQFSHKVTAFLVINTVLMNWASLLTMIYIRDITAISYYITGANTALSIVMGFYFYKAKAENLLKINQGYGYAPQPFLVQEKTNTNSNINERGL